MSICLVSMVRNEEPRIARMIASVYGLIDYAVILDTGSTDKTIDKARRALSGLGINHTIHQSEWVDFGTGRTELYALAQAHDWQILLDADMTATVGIGAREWLLSGEATADAYSVQMRQPGLDWRLPMLTRGKQEWRYVGAIHEGLDLTDRAIRELFPETLSIWHHGDNGRAGKLEERLALLTIDEDDPRSVYYAAQTLRDLGRTEEAIEFYERCAAMPGDEGHQWHASYQAALLDRDPVRLISVANERPGRAEPLRSAARILSEMADEMTVPTDLFVEPSAYR